MVELLNYSKAYGKQTILSIPNFQLKAGIHLIQGINGSGKTSLFKSIAGITSFRGDCLVDGLSVKENPTAYRKIVNFCEAEPAFPNFLSGKEITHFVSKAKNTSEQEFKEFIDSFGLLSFWDKPISSYSSGMLKKIALTIAFLGSPKLILLDEPFITIDQRSKKVLCELIFEYHKNGCSFLISAHETRSNVPLDFDSYLVVNEQALSHA